MILMFQERVKEAFLQSLGSSFTYDKGRYRTFQARGPGRASLGADMNRVDIFDLPERLSRMFPGLSLGGHLFQQWTTALRFEIGAEHVSRAEEVFRSVSEHSPLVVLASEDSSWAADPARWYSLFSLPGLLRASIPIPRIQSYEHVLPGGDEQEDRYTVSWASFSPAQVVSRNVFQAIANQDRGGSPSVRGQVYILDPSTEVLFWMYDDRGMEVLASSQKPLLHLQKCFASWILERRLETEPGIRRWQAR